MHGFDESWLRDHQARMAQTKPSPAASVATANMIAFTLPKPTVLLNVLLRMHWADRTKHARALSQEIAALIPNDPYRKPFRRAAVLIRRMSIKLPDYDNAVGGAKLICDCLLKRSPTHPNGLGLLVDDDPEHMALTVECERVATRAEQRTIVTIERIG